MTDQKHTFFTQSTKYKVGTCLPVPVPSSKVDNMSLLELAEGSHLCKRDGSLNSTWILRDVEFLTNFRCCCSVDLAQCLCDRSVFDWICRRLLLSIEAYRKLVHFSRLFFPGTQTFSIFRIVQAPRGIVPSEKAKKKFSFQNSFSIVCCAQTGATPTWTAPSLAVKPTCHGLLLQLRETSSQAERHCPQPFSFPATQFLNFDRTNCPFKKKRAGFESKMVGKCPMSDRYRHSVPWN